MNATLTITGIFHTDPFGIPLFKHSEQIKPVIINLSNLASQAQQVFHVGPVTVGAAAEVDSDPPGADVDVDIKIAIGGLPIYDHKYPLIQHIQAGSQPIKVGGGQLEFDGTVTITEAE